MQMNHGFAPILAGPHEPDRRAFGVGIGVELRMPAEGADIGLVWKID